MDQFDRNSRQRLMEKVVQHRLASAERDRDQAHLMGYADEGIRVRRPLLLLVVLIVLLTLVVAGLVAIGGPAGERRAETLGPAWGTATEEKTRVQAPAWWEDEP